MVDDVEAFVSVADVLRERGAYKIYVMATHGVLSADAPRRSDKIEALMKQKSALDDFNLPKLD